MRPENKANVMHAERSHEVTRKRTEHGY